MQRLICVVGLLGMVSAWSARAADHSVSVGNNFFGPPSLMAEVGDTVTWTWINGQHNVTSNSCAVECLGSGNRTPFDTYGYTFSQQGTFDYNCTLHPGMNGQVTVVAPIPEPLTGMGVVGAMFLLGRRRVRR